MRKRLKIIFTLAVASVVAILIFQAYWVYNSYQTGARNFKASVANALERSIDKYPLAVSELPSTLRSKAPFLTMMNTPQDDGKGTFRLQQVPVSSANLSSVQLLVARLLTETAAQPIKLDVLNKLFTEELKKNNINLPFKLELLKNRKNLPADSIAAFAGFSKNNTIVVAQMERSGQHLLSQNIVPAVVSLLLILLSAGSLYYMSLIIRRQMQLDGLKNDFINNITHELRTPIAILKSSHESLLNFSDLSDKEKTARHLKTNVSILDKLDNNVDRILDITRYERGFKSIHLELVNVDELVLGVVDRFAIKDGSDIRYLSGMNGQLVKTDHYIIDTILTNLVDNALKYSEERAIVHIYAELLKGAWQLKVSDSGIGISDANLPYIFDKFYRVTTGNIHDVKGYGLGLSYVKQLINNLHGSISVTSKPGKGTEFTIKLPLNE